LLNEGANIMPTTDTASLDTRGSAQDMAAAYDAFLCAYPTYVSTSKLDDLRAAEYARLDQQRQIYLDYTGGSVYAEAQVREQALGFTQEELAPCFLHADDLSYEQFLHVIDGKTTGALRASLGLATTFADVYQYVAFARTFVDRRVSPPN
jgi:hypothetical protein